MNTPMKLAVVVLVVAAAVGVALVKPWHEGPPAGPAEAPAEVPAEPVTPGDVPPDSAAPVAARLPRLVDLGAGKCIPCKAMAPILESLRRDFAGRFDVTFIDVWQDREAGKAYGIRLIPTQVFYDADGNELFRHEGFISREDILGKWRELGFAFEPTDGAGAGP